MTKNWILILLFSVVTLELYSEYYHLKELMFFTKPVILPIIAAFFLANSNHIDTRVRKTMLGAFLFSWIGDISLMFTPEAPLDTELMGVPKNKYLFFVGLSSFLVAQLLFISSYRKAVLPQKNKVNIIWFFGVATYWVAILGIVLPPVYANPEKSISVIPVTIYATVLILMVIFAIIRFGKTNSLSFWITTIGACIFVLSDSLIAINFLVMETTLSQAGLMIMTTYIAAEFLIATGILLHYRKIYESHL